MKCTMRRFLVTLALAVVLFPAGVSADYWPDPCDIWWQSADAQDGGGAADWRPWPCRFWCEIDCSETSWPWGWFCTWVPCVWIDPGPSLPVPSQ